jgi:hypothetical protein
VNVTPHLRHPVRLYSSIQREDALGEKQHPSAKTFP